MTNKLFVGSLPYSLTDAELQTHFEQVGKVLSAKVIVDRYSGRGKGFGFVEMENEAMAQEAVEKLNNSTLGGRTIVVNEAKPQERRENRSFGGGNRDYNNDRRNDRDDKRW